MSFCRVPCRKHRRRKDELQDVCGALHVLSRFVLLALGFE